MLTHPTLDLLHELGLSGMASGFKALDANPEAHALGHAEWLGLLLDHEATAMLAKGQVHTAPIDDSSAQHAFVLQYWTRLIRTIATAFRPRSSPTPTGCTTSSASACATWS